MRDLLLGSRISDTHLPHVRIRTPLYSFELTRDWAGESFSGTEDFLAMTLECVLRGAKRFPPRLARIDDGAAFSTISEQSIEELNYRRKEFARNFRTRQPHCVNWQSPRTHNTAAQCEIDITVSYKQFTSAIITSKGLQTRPKINDEPTVTILEQTKILLQHSATPYRALTKS